MIKTVSLTAGIEMAVELMGGYHCCIENRGSGVIYASKYSGISADADGVTAIDSGNSKVLRNIAQYKKDNDIYDYYGKIYLLSDSDTKAEIQTANDLSFFNRKNSAKGGVYDDTELRNDIEDLQSGIFSNASGKGLSTNDYTTAEQTKLAGLENYDDTEIKQKIEYIAGTSRKNLCNITYTSRKVDTINVKVNSDKTISLLTDSTATVNVVELLTPLITLKANVTYILSGGISSVISLELRDENKNPIAFDRGSGTEYTSGTDKKIYVALRISSGTEINPSVTLSPMLRIKDTDSTYEPYQDDLQTQINNILARLNIAGI